MLTHMDELAQRKYEIKLREEGIAKAREEAWAKAREEGVKKVQEALLETARKLLQIGLGIDQVVQATGIDPKRLRTMR